MPSQGPIVVATGSDGGGGSALWSNAAGVASTSSSNVAQAGSVGPTSPTDVLQCKFNAAAFAIPAGDTVTDIKITFNAWATASPGPIRVKSVKTSLTGSADIADLASLTSTDTAFTYTFSGLNVTPTLANGAWEIDLVFDAATNSSASINVYNVEATLTYQVFDLSYLSFGLDANPSAYLPRLPHFQPPPIESIDPTVLLLPAEPEPIHAEVLAPMFVQRAPTPRSRPHLSPIMGEYDPTVLLLPAEPEPLHPENYPPMTLLPNPRPQREAWQFPIMASTDYTSLLSGEAAHPETTRQAGQDLPRRDWPRQYQPPMERIDPGSLAGREEPKADWLPGISQPVRQFRLVRQPVMEATSYVWATPGDPALYPDRMAMQTPQRAFIRERRPMAGETVVLDAWSGQQYFVQPMWQPVPPGRRVQQPHIQAGQTPPQHFQEAQVLAWAVPLSQPVLPLARGRAPLMQGELAGETVQLTLAIPSDWQGNAPDVLNPRSRARVAAGETVVLQQTAATVPQGWESPAPEAGKAPLRQIPAIEARNSSEFATSRDRLLVEPMGLPVRALPRPETAPTLAGVETTPQVVPPSYAFLDYDPNLSQPVKRHARTLKLPIESAALDTISLSLPMSEHPAIALPVRPLAQPQRQSHLAPPYSDATNAADNSVGFMGMQQPRPVHRKPLAPSSEAPLVVTPAGLQQQFTIEPMFAGTRAIARPQQQSTAILVDQQYFPVPWPSQYEAEWIVPQPRPRIQPRPIESISTTVYLVGANPAAFTGSGAIVVANGGVYSLSPVAGKVVRASKGL